MDAKGFSDTLALDLNMAVAAERFMVNGNRLHQDGLARPDVLKRLRDVDAPTIASDDSMQSLLKESRALRPAWGTASVQFDSDGESPEMASLVASFVDGAVSFRAIPAVEASRNVDAVLVLKWRTIRRVIFEARRKGTITLAPGDLDRADGSAELLNALRTVALLPAVARVLAARVE